MCIHYSIQHVDLRPPRFTSRYFFSFSLSWKTKQKQNESQTMRWRHIEGERSNRISIIYRSTLWYIFFFFRFAFWKRRNSLSPMWTDLFCQVFEKSKQLRKMCVFPFGQNRWRRRTFGVGNNSGVVEGQTKTSASSLCGPLPGSYRCFYFRCKSNRREM